ncbi:alpha/beta fold hydrolase [Roseateles oligotrophus]|uniref:Alpha/beta fold hydrolase n=1 Tax=Roseateles oligotrophus TaxID=1769250 RepID=A0ABT2YLZ2_9BURK|nr:alpha/beta fold hydrolase [Roseateles oligotrophus]MCV2370951.1 alpha/beta fold hydrolase [Roseateles oligotrophus]
MKAWLFRRAMASERKRAGLAVQRRQLSFGSLAYLDSGAAAESGKRREVLLLLHGACADHSSWLRFARALGPQRRLLVPDLPGHGESVSSLDIADMADMDLGIAAQAERLIEWLGTLGVSRLHLVGNSMGGALALRLAQQRPQWVQSLILIDAAGAESRPSELRAHVERGHKHPMIEVDSLADYRAMLDWGMAKKPWLPRFIMQILLDQKRQRRSIERRILADLARDQDQRAGLAGIRAPTLILWGGLDRVLHVADADLLAAAIPGSRKHVFAELGHVPMVEAPDLVAAHCREFLRELSS